MSETPGNEQAAPAPPAAAAKPAANAGAAPAAFEDLRPAAEVRPGIAPLDSLLDISVDVSIRFGRARMTVQEVLALGPGSVVQLDRMVGEPIDVYVSDRKFGEGEIVVIGDHFGIRLTKVAPAGAAVSVA